MTGRSGDTVWRLAQPVAAAFEADRIVLGPREARQLRAENDGPAVSRLNFLHREARKVKRMEPSSLRAVQNGPKKRRPRIMAGLLAIQEGRCWYCWRPITDEPSEVGAARVDGEWLRRATIEHLTRRADGGTNDWANLRAVCERCNQRRGDRPAPPRGGLASPKMKDKAEAWRFPLEKAAIDLIRLGCSTPLRRVSGAASVHRIQLAGMAVVGEYRRTNNGTASFRLLDGYPQAMTIPV